MRLKRASGLHQPAKPRIIQKISKKQRCNIFVLKKF